MPMSWVVDDVVVHKVVEEVAGYTTPEHFFLTFESQQHPRSLADFTGNGYNADRHLIELSYHSYIVETPEFTALIDACIGNDKTIPIRPAWHEKHDNRWKTELEAAGCHLDDIDYVVCTHLHLDHVGWNTVRTADGWRPTFPRAQYLFVDREYRFTESWPATHRHDDPLGLTPVFEASFAQSLDPLQRAGQLELVPPDHSVGRYLRFIPTPGHTPGHTAFGVGRDRNAVVFTGDLLHSPLQIGEPGLATAADEDVDLATQTRLNFLERFADTGVLVCTMHFPESSAGHISGSPAGFSFQYAAPTQRPSAAQ